MTLSKFEAGESIDLRNYYSNLPRREFLKLGTGAAVAGLGLSTLVERAYGAEPEGKTIVHTRDRKGRPAKVRVIDPERYRRLQIYSQYPSSKIQGAKGVNGLSITQRSSNPKDIALHFYVNDESVGESLPNTVEEMPVEKALQDSVEEMPVEFSVERSEAHPHAIQGGSEVETEDNSRGTAWLCCYEESSDDGMILTADHVMDQATKMMQNGDHIGWYAYSDPRNGGDGMDATAYNATFGTDVDLLDTIVIDDVVGYWTFSGLSDATSSSNISANAYGDTSGKVSNEVRRTNRNDIIEYQAAYKKNHDPTEGGDSGMPWVDNDGYIISHHYGDKETWLGERWNVGGVAEQFLDSVYANLDPNNSPSTK